MLDSNLLRYNLKDSKFIVWDFETESLNLCYARPWQLGYQIYHGNKLIEEKEVYIKWPNLNVSAGATKVTGFDAKRVELYGKEPKLVLERLDSYLYNKEYKIVGANLLGYDIFIHNVMRNELGFKTDYSYLNRVYDVVCLSKAYKLGLKIPENREDFLPFQYRMLNFIQKGLKTSNSVMAKEFGYEVDDTMLHGAAYDCRLSSFTFFNLIKKLDIQ